jgi:hypothetical protein
MTFQSLYKWSKVEKNIKNSDNLLQKRQKAKKNLFDKTRGLKIVAGSELSLVSGNSMSWRNQLSWKWRHMARKSARFCGHFLCRALPPVIV